MSQQKTLEELLALPLPDAINVLRIMQSKTMKQASEELGLSPSEYCKMVYRNRQLPDLKVDTSILIEAHCHQCQKTFECHPIIGVVFPAYVCDECRKMPV